MKIISVHVYGGRSDDELMGEEYFVAATQERVDEIVRELEHADRIGRVKLVASGQDPYPEAVIRVFEPSSLENTVKWLSDNE